MTHSQLVNIGYKWALSKCAFAFKEFKCINLTGEIPDVIGFRSECTFLLEAKTSYQDFKRDEKKIFREWPDMGMGDFRFYIATEGLIPESDLPDMWGLIEVNDFTKKPKVIINPFGKGNQYYQWQKNPKNEYAERCMMYSGLRRLDRKTFQDKILTK